MNRNETGIVIVITAMIILALVGVVAMLAHYAYLSSVQSELQSVADAASLTAAGRLNSATTGWADAKEAALRTLNGLSVLSSVGCEKRITLDIDQEGPEWDLSDVNNLKVKVERGLWMPPKANEPAKFTSYEGDWQANNPGVPRFVAANSVRVSIERPKTRIFGSPFGGVPEYSVEATSIALRGPPDAVCVAPFALPVCALINESGEFEGSNICKGDRLFTKADRYCPRDLAAADCAEKTLPSTPYTPVGAVSPPYQEGGMPNAVVITDPLEQTIDDPFSETTLRDLLTKPGNNVDPPITEVYHNWGYSCINSYIDEGAWVRQQKFSAVSDHYGVFGLPGEVEDSELIPRITEIFARTSAYPDACVKTFIGETFKVLGEGLSSKDLGTQIWNVVNNSGQALAASTGSHVPYSQTMLESIEKHFEVVELEMRTIRNGATVPPFRYVCETPNRHIGICNSHRGQYKLVIPGIRTDNMPFPNKKSWAFYRFELKPEISDDSATWKIKIPVIAEQGAGVAACRGVQSVNADPLVATGKNYTIIGFVDLIVYDVDMGEPPPEYPITKPDESGTEPFPVEMRFQEPCNNVRARITCESQFVPSSVPEGYAAPRLVVGQSNGQS